MAMISAAHHLVASSDASGDSRLQETRDKLASRDGKTSAMNELSFSCFRCGGCRQAPIDVPAA